MSKWEFLRPYEQWDSPRQVGPFRVLCQLTKAARERSRASASLGETPATELEEFWALYESGTLFRDVDYGQWGLEIYSRTASRRETSLLLKLPLPGLAQTDIVFAKFIGDLECLVVDGLGAALVAKELEHRSAWYREPRLSEFLRKYVAADGLKFWSNS
jgi:hypothetical protein